MGDAEKFLEKTRSKKEKSTVPIISTRKIPLKDYSYILDEFEQLKTYFRKGTRPSMQKAIENFEKHLKELIKY